MTRLNAPIVTATTVFIVGLVLSIGASIYLEKKQEAEAHERFAELADRTTELVGRRLQLFEYGLRGMRGAVVTMGQESVSRERVLIYSQTREQNREFPGSRGYGFIKRVAPANFAQFKEIAKAERNGNFNVRELAPHDGEHFVIQYIEPEEKNKEAIGLDIASEKNRREAAYQAIKTGKATLTHPISLVQASGKPSQGFLLMIPAFTPYMPLKSEDDRNAAAFGLAYSPLIIDEILADFDLHHGEFSIALYDIGDTGQPSLFYRSANATTQQSFITERKKLNLFGRTWIVETHAHAPFIESLNQHPSTLIALSLGTTSLLIAGLIYGITVSRIKKREIARARARLAAIVEGANDAIVGLNDTGTISDWNSAAATMFGYSADIAVGNTTAIILPVAHQGEDLELLRQVLAGKTVDHFSTTRRKADGSTFPVSVTFSVIRDDKGHAIGAAMTIRDITEEVKAQNRILELNATLEKKVSERTANLEAALEELADFSYLASHDLRTPLRAIDGYSSLIQRDPALPPTTREDYLQRIRQAAQNMGKVIDDILSLAKITRKEVKPETINLSELAHRIVDTLKSMQPERRVEIVIEPQLLIQADKELMRIAITQLIDNAWKFTRDTQSPRIELGQIKHGETPEFFIRDNGIGFDMQYAAKLFNAFQRLHPDGSYPGTGIGLAIVQRVIRKHGGTIRAEGNVNQGATFYFYVT